MTDPTIEHEKLFEHEYDGIREYDNPMPRWWVWTFWLSIFFALPYLMWYHLGEGPSILDRLEAEQTAYAELLLATYGELEPDEATILRFKDDDVAMTGMSSLFKSKCAQCHLADGSGNVGPNLTDDHYLNVKVVTDIPGILTNGLVEKGMPKWGDALTETQIILLSSYVARLRENTVPSGKIAEGEAIAPWPPTPAVEPDEG